MFRPYIPPVATAMQKLRRVAYVSDFLMPLATQPFGADCQAAALVIFEPQSTVTQLLPQHSILPSGERSDPSTYATTGTAY